MIMTVIIGVAGAVAAPVYLVHFAMASRHDPMTPDAQGRGARWARRAAGMSVYRSL